jgi:hypothetical protein
MAIGLSQTENALQSEGYEGAVVSLLSLAEGICMFLYFGENLNLLRWT